ncbi:esterase family protein [Mycobacterium sp. MYCO198283]|uniref:alpha/beta hydrolase n=1 Tax=Mycobacterium sp. MYCO198283 TaxID=2883505 RepID=UPI001E3A50A0|nr:alpha/beta hydrolase-fold protein [Mycobacterium sp. MYCO198283]MCG5433452.1 esterase family protein [Mycobacterium sp. MYCO198283]
MIAGFPAQLSLLTGWLPIVIQLAAALTLVVAVDRRPRRRRLLCAVLAAAVVVAGAAIGLRLSGSAGEPAPLQLWWWLAATAAAAVLVLARWRGVRWWRRVAKLAAVPACALCAVLAVNTWTGYLPTVGTAWNQLTSGPLPDEADGTAVSVLVAHHAMPATGKVVPLVTGEAVSGFHHREELVYLPPAWFRSSPPPALPLVLMIGGEFNTPADWIRTGNAVTTADAYAARHRGVAPILVFADPGGAFANDTECVNGPRGRAADHLVAEVVPTAAARFSPAGHPARWGVAGWSMGGTCAVDLAVMHPEVFSAFVDIAGDVAPNSGTVDQTVARLFGGDRAAWSAFDPLTVMARHGPYHGLAGWFDVNGDVRGHRGDPRVTGDQLDAATVLCGAARARGVDCDVHTRPGHHDWPFAASAWAAALPWLTDRLTASPGPHIVRIAVTAPRGG